MGPNELFKFVLTISEVITPFVELNNDYSNIVVSRR